MSINILNISLSQKFLLIKINILFPAAEIGDVIVEDYTLTINLNNPSSNFEFSVDYLNGFQSSNVFRNLTPGSHILYVRDVYRCNLVQQTFYVFELPQFFTPNGDGINDTWNVLGIDPLKYTNAINVYIYDRYGKLLAVFNPLESNGWDGTRKGVNLPTDDYWYRFKVPDGRQFSGHFTLKR
ncbi:T9SS type B sorting domain-containing protein [Formosa sediminum]|uniref:T9SS type B sorting domain-containing protein n=1 Tax=Formosa sediminum TaxID=2594004 RepID=A0A516GUB9_9FLAO|nr:T9SS type B sorting domain-containing protein [Formosa sediminum]QDO95119.1 T9SS type B sorting domain-containing protein [Formosa sediminum]